jgi:3-vinyl bacteriochlorophyllide hydratase
VASDDYRRASATQPGPGRGAGLYTPEERQRRDATPWTLVQGVLAPIQFLVFLVSSVLVVRFLMTGSGEEAAIASILLKTLLLYTIMVTGSIWEKVVFGKWLFAEPFWWEDLVSFLVIGLHTLYLAALLRGWWTTEARMALALLAYAIYAVNATQFLLKLRAARLQAAGIQGDPSAADGVVA